MESYNYFELHRMIDGLIYQFDRMEISKGVFAYKRRDKDLWITYKPEIGWVAYDEEKDLLHGVAWNVLPKDQNKDFPPEGVWVSRKDERSYVYELKYMEKK